VTILCLFTVVACTGGEEAPPRAFPIEPERACAPVADACGATSATSTTVAASYRKDYFLSYDEYPEADIPDPLDGGRIQIVVVVANP